MRTTPSFRYPAPQPTPKGLDRPLLTFLAVIVLAFFGLLVVCIVKAHHEAVVAPADVPVASSSVEG